MFVVLGGSIKDITEQCTFEWIQEPNPRKAYLEISDATGDFTEGEIIENLTDGTSTAKVFSSYVDGNRVYIEDISGSFNHGDQIKGNTSGQTATVDGFVEERSYPDNVIHGTFPDSIVSKDLDDYLEWESSLAGSGYSMKLCIYLPEPKLCFILPIIGKGERIDNNEARIYLYLWRYCKKNDDTAGMFSTRSLVIASEKYNGFGDLYGSAGFQLVYAEKFLVYVYQSDKATLKNRLHSIRIFELLI